MAFFIFVLCLIGAGMAAYGGVHFFTRGVKDPS